MIDSNSEHDLQSSILQSEDVAEAEVLRLPDDRIFGEEDRHIDLSAEPRSSVPASFSTSSHVGEHRQKKRGEVSSQERDHDAATAKDCTSRKNKSVVGARLVESKPSVDNAQASTSLESVDAQDAWESSLRFLLHNLHSEHHDYLRENDEDSGCAEGSLFYKSNYAEGRDGDDHDSMSKSDKFHRAQKNLDTRGLLKQSEQNPERGAPDVNSARPWHHASHLNLDDGEILSVDNSSNNRSGRSQLHRSEDDAFAQASWIEFPPCVFFRNNQISKRIEEFDTNSERRNSMTQVQQSSFQDSDSFAQESWTEFPPCGHFHIDSEGHRTAHWGDVESDAEITKGTHAARSKGDFKAKEERADCDALELNSSSETASTFVHDSDSSNQATTQAARVPQTFQDTVSPGAYPVDGFLSQDAAVLRNQRRDLGGPVSSGPVNMGEMFLNVSEATVVDEPETPQIEEAHVQYAVPIDKDEPTCNKLIRSKWFWGIVVATLAAFVAIFFGLRFGYNTDPSTAPQPAPSNSTDRVAALVIANTFDATGLTYASSPQSKALAWLKNNTDIEKFSGRRILQRYALATFFYSTNGHNWTDSRGWLSNDHECTWFNVDGACSDGSIVSRLDFHDSDLGGNNLSGMLPPDLALLSDSLALIDFDENFLVGSIPSEFGLLHELSILSLLGNDMTSIVPSEIGNLERLRYIDLSENDLGGSIPTEIGRLPNIEELHLRGNHMVGSIPTEIGQLTKLELVTIHDNDLQGSIPTELCLLSNTLVRLILPGNKLVGSIPSEIGKLSKLEKINLGRNRITGSIPSETGQLSILYSLQLFDLRLSGSIPDELFLLTALELLWLQDNQLTGSLPTQIGAMKELGSLRVQINSLAGTVPSEIDNLSSLSEFHLFNNSFTPPYTCPDSIDECYASCEGEGDCRKL